MSANTSLTGDAIKTSYVQLLHVSDTGGMTSTITQIYDGDGTASSLYLGTVSAKVILGTSATNDFTVNDGTTDMFLIQGDSGAGAIAFNLNDSATDTMVFTNTQGTNAASINLVSTAGGVTIASGGDILLTATADVIIPANVGITFGTGEKIEGDSTDLTITSGGAINLTAVTDVVVPTSVGITYGAGEKIEGDDTDLTVTSGGAINLTAVTDVVVPANVGVTFGSGEKIEGDNTDLTVTSGALINLTATSDVDVTLHDGSNGLKLGGTLVTASAAEINRACDTSAKIVTIAATDAITAAEHESRVNLLGEVGGDAIVTLTLPAATGTGSRYYFCVSVVNTSNYVIQKAGSGTFDGSVSLLDADSNAQTAYKATGATSIITLNGTSQGGQIGDWLEFIDIATDQWAISGQLVCPAGSNVADPFS